MTGVGVGCIGGIPARRKRRPCCRHRHCGEQQGGWNTSLTIRNLYDGLPVRRTCESISTGRLTALRRSVNRGSPFGDETRAITATKKLSLENTALPQEFSSQPFLWTAAALLPLWPQQPAAEELLSEFTIE